MGIFGRYLKGLRDGAVARYKEHILGFIDRTEEPIRILDCGCDDGAWTVRFLSRAPNAQLCGIEIVESQAEKARKRGIDARFGNLNERFPFGDAVFDVVHANQVIEHVTNTDNFVSEIRRVLAPGGCAIICTENLASRHNIFSLVMGWQPFSLTNVSQKKFQIGNPLAFHADEEATNPASWQHMRVFSYGGLTDLLREWGFGVEAVRGAGYYPLPSWVSQLDPRHAAFLALKARKAEGPNSGEPRT
jgi:SAM-dependent methyltransferase